MATDYTGENFTNDLVAARDHIKAAFELLRNKDFLDYAKLTDINYGVNLADPLTNLSFDLSDRVADLAQAETILETCT